MNAKESRKTRCNFINLLVKPPKFLFFEKSKTSGKTHFVKHLMIKWLLYSSSLYLKRHDLFGDGTCRYVKCNKICNFAVTVAWYFSDLCKAHFRESKKHFVLLDAANSPSAIHTCSVFADVNDVTLKAWKHLLEDTEDWDGSLNLFFFFPACPCCLAEIFELHEKTVNLQWSQSNTI